MQVLIKVKCCEDRRKPGRKGLKRKEHKYRHKMNDCSNLSFKPLLLVVKLLWAKIPWNSFSTWGKKIKRILFRVSPNSSTGTNTRLQKIQCLFWFLHIQKNKNKTSFFIVLFLCPHIQQRCSENTVVTQMYFCKQKGIYRQREGLCLQRKKEKKHSTILQRQETHSDTETTSLYRHIYYMWFII